MNFMKIRRESINVLLGVSEYCQNPLSANNVTIFPGFLKCFNQEWPVTHTPFPVSLIIAGKEV